jgi:hypothetical protein
MAVGNGPESEAGTVKTKALPVEGLNVVLRVAVY